MKPKDYRKKAIFILGSPRTGSTWLYRLMRQHSQIYAITEGNFYKNSKQEEGNFFNFYLKEFTFKSDNHKKNWVRKKYFSKIPKDRCAFLDKTPDYALYIKDIVTFFPNCFIIHIVRNGLDVCASLKDFHYFRLKNYAPWGDSRPSNWRTEPDFQEFELDEKDILRWKKNIDAVLENKSLLKDGHFIQFRYEDFLVNTENLLGEVFNMVGLKREEKEIINYYTPKADDFSHLGKSPMIRVCASNHRYKNVLTEKEYNLFIESSGDLMKELGYGL